MHVYWANPISREQLWPATTSTDSYFNTASLHNNSALKNQQKMWHAASIMADFYLPSSLSERSSDSHVGQLVLMRRRLKSALKLFEPSVHIQHRICFSDTERRPTHDLQTCTVMGKMEHPPKDQTLVCQPVVQSGVNEATFGLFPRSLYVQMKKMTRGKQEVDV